MNSAITVREIDPGDKAWLKRRARQVGVSMEEFVRRLIREKRVNSERRAKPSEAFQQYFGTEHGVELPPPSATATDRFRSPTRTARDRSVGLAPRCQHRLGDDAAEAGTTRRAFHDSIAEEGIGVASSRRTTQNSNSTHPLRIGPLVISCMVAG